MSDLAKSIHNALKNQFKEDFNNELAEQIKETMQMEIDAKVYNAYQPTVYERTGELKDKANMPHKVIETNNGITLEFDNTRSENGKDISYLIEKGDNNDKGIHYDFPRYKRNPDKFSYLKPRPFMEGTFEIIKLDIMDFVNLSISKAIKKI